MILLNFDIIEAVEIKNKLKVTIRDVLLEYYLASRPFLVLLGIMTVTSIIPVLATGIITPIYYKDFFDILNVKAGPEILAPELVKTIFLVLIMNLLAWVSNRIYTWSTVRFQSDVMYRLRQSAYEHLIRHSHTFFTNNFTGSMVQKINRFMRSFERISDRFFEEIIQNIVRIIGVSFVLWNIQKTFVFIILFWVFIFLVISYFFSRWKMPYDIKNAEVESRTSARMSDSLSNHNTIQIFNRFDHESALFGANNMEHRNSMRARWLVGNKIAGIQSFLNILIEFLFFFYAIKFWIAGDFTIGTFVLIQMYIIGMIGKFWSFSQIMRDIYESFADAKEMVEIMKTEHEIKDIPGAKDLIVKEGLIDFNNVSFSYNEDREILSNLNLSIRPGERVALIGPSGAGKSTITKLLLRLYELSGGEILIDKQNISKSTQSSLRNAISFVPQDPILFHRTLAENIRYGALNATDEQVRNAAKLAYIDEFINSLTHGYETFVGERGVKLSGGERQRVAIARAILKNAPILILDEATSSLDSQSEMLIQDALENLMKNKTVIVIAHRLSTIRKMNRIIVIDEGKVLEQGTHEELLAREGLYSKLWNLQSKGFLVYSDNQNA